MGRDRKVRKVARLAAVTVAALAAIAVGGISLTYLASRRTLPPLITSRDFNAIWVKHAWVGSAHSDAEYEAFGEMLKRHRISDVYAHVGPLNGDGTIAPGRYPYAAKFLQQVRSHHRHVRIHAWIGQVEKYGGGPLDLASQDVRRACLNEARQLLAVGFDGIHYDVEPVRSGDPHYVDLLRETRRLSMAQGRLTSVAAFKALPPLVFKVIVAVSPRAIGLWDSTYFRDVAEQVDQVAVMMYDTALPRDYLYEIATAIETRYLAGLVAATTPLLIGVPTYDDERVTFHAEAENMESGLRGVRRGFAGLHRGPDGPLGVAIYADWTTDAAEWATYRRLWTQGD